MTSAPGMRAANAKHRKRKNREKERLKGKEERLVGLVYEKKGDKKVSLNGADVKVEMALFWFKRERTIQVYEIIIQTLIYTYCMFVCELTRIKTYSHTDRQINKTRRKAVIGTDIVKLTDRQKDKADRQTRQDMQTERKTQIQTVKQDIQKDSNGYRQSNILTDRQTRHT